MKFFLNVNLSVLFTSFLFIFGCEAALAQDFPRQEIDLDEFIQTLFAVQDEDIDYEEIYEALFQFYRNPINLNEASNDDLQSLYILSELQIKSLLDYRKKFGNFLSIYELQAVPNLDLSTIQKILPFVNVRDMGLSGSALPLWKRILSEKDNHYFILRYDRVLEEQKGFTEDATPSQKFLGTPGRIYARYRISHPKDFSFGFTVKKDSGEDLIWDKSTNRFGMDFYSFHAFLQNKGRFKSIAIGDYQIQMGQGLLLSAGFTVGKGAETVQTLRRSSLGIRPFTSSLETGFFRGIATTYQFGQVDVTTFYSNVKRDGAVSETNDTLSIGESEPEAFIETLRTSGLHRTQTEINGRGKFTEQTIGANLLFNSKDKNLQLGATFMHTTYNLRFQRNISSPKDSILYKYEFSGKENYNIGMNFSYNWQNFAFFGEAAQSKSGGRGVIGGFISSLSPTVDFAMVYRNYAKDFHTFFGSALGEGTRNINEEGIYWGIKISPSRKLKLAAYYDKFSFAHLRYRVDAPSKGYEYLARVSCAFSRKISIYAQFREEGKDRNLSSDDSQGAFRQIKQGIKRNYLLNLDYQAEKIFTFKSRVQFSSFDYNSKKTQGLALVQDVGVELGKFELNVRFALFDAEDFDNRQYIFEKDVLWAFSIPAYSGQGFRNYFLLRYKISKRFDLWLRYARFDYQNQENISSGGTEIAGNTRSEIKAQVRIKF